MGLFNDPGEAERKRRLKMMEDARLAFAQQMRQAGFAPEQMILTSTERGGLIGLSREGGELCLVIGPDFGAPEPFTLERCPLSGVRREAFFEAPEGLGGLLGLGKKGTKGFYLVVDRGGIELSVPFIINRNSAAAFSYKRNPLLNPKRRRGDANVVWDLQPLDSKQLSKVERALSAMLS